MWRPCGTEPRALILFSHHSGGTRNSAEYLCEHLASHGYAVAALDHSDVRLPRPSDALNEEQRAERLNAWIEARVPDIRFLLQSIGEPRRRVGIVGHSFGGWTALATPDSEPRVEAVVALAPAGATHPRPGIIPAQLAFAWKRDVPALVIAAEKDVSIPLDCVRDVYSRIPSSKRLVVLPNADHLHFIEDAAKEHERVRAMQWPPSLAWMQQEMQPFATLLSQDAAHRLIAAATLKHFDEVFAGQPR